MLISIGLYGQRQSQNIRPTSATIFTSEPSVAWKFNTAGPVFGSPVISEGLVYVGSLDSVFYALNLSTGNVQWKFKTGGEIRSTVCLMGDRLF